MQEVSRVRSTDRKYAFTSSGRLRKPIGKEQIHREPLNPHYVVGFIDGEGSFSIGVGKHKTLKRGLEIRPQFSIELRADDREVLERILVTIGCGRIYDCSYDRYGWYPHVKYKVGSIKDFLNYVFPFLDQYPLQAKKAKGYRIFREIILMFQKKEHLTDAGFKKIISLRTAMRKLGKKAKTYGNR